MLTACGGSQQPRFTCTFVHKTPDQSKVHQEAGMRTCTTSAGHAAPLRICSAFPCGGKWSSKPTNAQGQL
eukprot:1875386-Alexandrium_andersonii.AAC.1